jgi:ADP-ribose pyrophosphatase YjhB (NUDIX family)
MSRRQPFSYQEFTEIYSKVPRLTVEVLVVIGNGIILSKRQEASWQGMWHIPGGTVLYQESVAEAVKRLAQEELGLEVSVGELLGYIEYPSEQQQRGFGWSVGLAFKCEAETQFVPSEQHQIFSELPVTMLEEQRPVCQQVLDGLFSQQNLK